MRETSSVFCRFWHRAVTASLHSAQTARRPQLHLSGAHRGRQPLRCALCATEPPREARGACAEGARRLPPKFGDAHLQRRLRTRSAGTVSQVPRLGPFTSAFGNSRFARHGKPQIAAPSACRRVCHGSLRYSPPPSQKSPSFQKFPVYKREHMC